LRRTRNNKGPRGAAAHADMISRGSQESVGGVGSMDVSLATRQCEGHYSRMNNLVHLKNRHLIKNDAVLQLEDLLNAMLVLSRVASAVCD